MNLKSICDLLENYEGKPTRYWIPSYQRGYRWSTLQVTQLLDDIWEFLQNPKGDFYCLQPIVVKKMENDADFEIVDGQQRLTTIRILMTCLKVQLDALEKKPFEIGYETRETERFLNNIDTSRSEENIDYFYICEAYKAINDWFEQRDSKHKLRVLQHLLNDDDQPNVRVIWYELKSSDNPVNAFTRLNIGKIPLTNDELIRALFLRHSNSKVLGLDQANIALEWDRFEKKLQDDNFWCFLNNDLFRIDNRISHLFELIIDHQQIRWRDRDPYWLFYAFDRRLQNGEVTVSEEWKSVRKVFLTLQEWYSDKRLYHLIGFLIHQGMSTKKLLSWSKNARKSEFNRKLVHNIFKTVFHGNLYQIDKNRLSEELSIKISNIQYNYTNRSKICSILLLFNLVTLIESPNSNSRFPFDQFKKENWDIEHVRSISSKRLNQHEERVEWFKNCLEVLSVTSHDSEICNRIEEFINLPAEVAERYFEELYDVVRDFFGEKDRSEESDNSIANLALLDRNTNRSYKNAVFAVKRSYILSLDGVGTFVPPCTRNVFLKYYSKNAQQVMFWSEEDERNYQENIADTLFKFFSCENQ